MRSCLGAAIQRDWHQHDCPHSKNKGTALRPSEPSVVWECPNATQAGGSSFGEGDYHEFSAAYISWGSAELIRRVPGMSGGIQSETSTATDFRAYMA
jgi:hypothetical protein